MSYFGGGGGGGDDDEYAYDYQSSSKNKKSTTKANNSPQFSSTKHVPKQNNVVVVDSSNALDRAKNMLSKYSNKPSEPVTKPKPAKSFNEDDLSMSEDLSDMDMSDSGDFKHKTANTKSKNDPKTKKNKKNINDLGSPEAIVTVSMGDNEEESDVDFDDAAREFLNRSNLSDSAQKGDFEEDSEHDNYSNEDFDVEERFATKKAAVSKTADFEMDMSESDALEHTAEEEFGSNNDFEIDQSNAHTASNNDFEVENDEDDDNNDASYSRMVYGNGDDEEEEEVHSSVEDREVDEDEVDDDMEVSNKPIILSFADLAAIPSWEQTSFANGDLAAGQSEIDESVEEVEDSEILERPAHGGKSVPDIASSRDSDSYDEDEYNDEFEESRVESPPPVAAAPVAVTVKSVAPTVTKVEKPVAVAPVASSAAVVSKKETPKTSAPVVVPQSAPVVASAPAPVAPVAAAVAPSSSALTAVAEPPPPAVASAAPPAYQPPYPYPPPPSYYGYPYGPPPGAAAPPGYPPSDQQQYPPPPPHAHHPYPYPYAPPPYSYYPPPYSMYPSPYGPPPAAPPQPAPYYDPRASLLGLGGQGYSNTSAVGQQNPFSPFPYPQSLVPSPFAGNNASSAQPLVLDLLQELRKTKEEAEWAKQKLAETMLFVRDQEASVERLRKSSEAVVGSVSSATVSSSSRLGSPKASKTPAAAAIRTAPVPTATTAAARRSRYSELDRSVSESLDEVNESQILEDVIEANDYSDDFDQESHLNLSTYSSAGAGVIGGGGGKNSPLKSVKHVTLPNIPEEPLFRRVAAAAVHAAPVEKPSTQPYVPPAWRTAERPVMPVSRESVVDPLKQSLAHSLLSSQEMFKNQIESLRLRLSMANSTSSVAERHWEATRSSLPASYPTMYPTTTFKPAASLADLKNEFAKKRLDDTRKLYEVLTRAYPDLEEAEAVYIAEKF